MERGLTTLVLHEEPSVELVREFVVAGHGNLEKVKIMFEDHPELLNVSYKWKENDLETAVQGAAHVGAPAVAEHLLERGAPLEIARRRCSAGRTM